MKLLIGLVLLFEFVASCSCASAMWQDLVVLDCTSTLHIAPNHPLFHLGINATLATQVYSYVTSLLVSKAQCHCPQLTDAQLKAGFSGDFGIILSALEQTSDSNAYPAACGFTNPISRLAETYSLVGSLPTATCSSARWAQGLPCFVQLPLTNYAITLQLTVTQCPSSASSAMPSSAFGGAALPFVSISCSGTACQDFLVPCQKSSDCPSGKSNCVPFSASALSSVQSSLSSFLQNSGLFTAPSSLSCSVGNIPPSPLPAQNLIDTAVNFFVNRLGVGSGTSSTSASSPLNFCAIDVVTPQPYRSILSSLWSYTSCQPYAYCYGWSAYWTNRYSNSQLPDWIRTTIDPYLPTTYILSPLMWFSRNVLGAITVYLQTAFDYGMDTIVYVIGTVDSVTVSLQQTLANQFVLVSNPSNPAHSLLQVPLQEWNGVMDNGGGGADSSRLRGTAFPQQLTLARAYSSQFVPSSGLVLVVVDPASSQLALFPGAPLSMSLYLPPLDEFANALYTNLLYNLEQCENTNILSRNELRARFNPLTGDLLLKFLTSSGSSMSINTGNDVATVLSVTSPRSVVNLPSSCSLQQWQTTGHCQARFTGLSTLLNKKADIVIVIDRDPTLADGVPRVLVNCEGSDCTNLFTPYRFIFCTQNSDCPNGRICHSLGTYFSSSAVIGNLLWGASSTDYCDNPAVIDVDVINFFNIVTGTPRVDPHTMNPGFCALDYETSLSQSTFNAWKATLTSTDAIGNINVNMLVADSSSPTVAPIHSAAASTFHAVKLALSITLSCLLLVALFSPRLDSL